MISNAMTKYQRQLRTFPAHVINHDTESYNVLLTLSVTIFYDEVSSYISYPW
jgi:hypothetical protein